jgi:hypothetical protein
VPANGTADDGADETARPPATPAGAGGPSRLPSFGAQVPPQAPSIPAIGSQNVRGGDGPSAGDSGPNGVQGTDGASDSGQVTVPPPGIQESRLPIFDSLESDWFRRSGKNVTTARAPASAEGAQEALGVQGVQVGQLAAQSGQVAAQSWTSPADEGWRAAQALAAPSAGDTTQAGLPRRVPRANLVPGSVGGGGGDTEVDVPARSPDVARTRMASFQRGVREGRAAAPQTEES